MDIVYITNVVNMTETYNMVENLLIVEYDSSDNIHDINIRIKGLVSCVIFSVLKPSYYIIDVCVCVLYVCISSYYTC